MTKLAKIAKPKTGGVVTAPRNREIIIGSSTIFDTDHKWQRVSVRNLENGGGKLAGAFRTPNVLQIERHYFIDLKEADGALTLNESLDWIGTIDRGNLPLLVHAMNNLKFEGKDMTLASSLSDTLKFEVKRRGSMITWDLLTGFIWQPPAPPASITEKLDPEIVTEMLAVKDGRKFPTCIDGIIIQGAVEIDYASIVLDILSLGAGINE